MDKRDIPVGVLMVGGFGLLLLLSAPTDSETDSNFKRQVIDAQGPVAPWGKSVGDLNGDGRLDLLVGGHGAGGLVWYENPTWKRHVIDAAGRFGTDIEVVDVNRDGKQDVMAIREDGLYWYRNPDWTPTRIDDIRLHSVEYADLDGDGRVDIVARNQSVFGGESDKVFLYRQRDPGHWDKLVLPVPDGEGLKLADLNGDRRIDIIVNGMWYANPGRFDWRWEKHTYTETWSWPHTFIAVGDVNGDGRPDIALSPAERAGDRYRLSWFEAPSDPRGMWTEHVVQADIEAVQHFVAIADLDGDGQADLVTAAMHQGADPDEIVGYYNRGPGAAFERRVLGTQGSHSMRVADFDGDGDLDLFGANWDGPRQEVTIWSNHSCPGGLGRWARHLIDAERPGRATFVAAQDLDGDGRSDVVSGGYWYRNPATARGVWERRAFGSPLQDVALVADWDGDGRPDVLGTGEEGTAGGVGLVWAKNLGNGQFRVLEPVARAGGDFLQGAVSGRFRPDGPLEVALSWHSPGKGIQMLTVPANPLTLPWTSKIISQVSQDEQLSVGDIDRDGDLDLGLGTIWLRNDWSQWQAFSVVGGRPPPDRHRLVDLNGDGRLDMVVGFEAASRSGDVIWYEQGASPTEAWREHRIATVIGPMSLDVGDLDGDGDLDVVVGEHHLLAPQRARLWVFENLDGRGTRWRPHLVHTGDEHHDGAILADLDGDGDLDIVSIGWGHQQVIWYENRAPRCVASDVSRAATRRN